MLYAYQSSTTRDAETVIKTLESDFNNIKDNYMVKVIGESSNALTFSVGVSEKPLVMMKLYYYQNNIALTNPLDKNNMEIYINEKLLENKEISMVQSIYSQHKTISTAQLPEKINKAIKEYKPPVTWLSDMKATQVKVLLFEYYHVTLETLLQDKKYNVDDKMMTSLFFQVVYALYVLSTNFNFSYNNLDLQDIVIGSDIKYSSQGYTPHYYIYNINNTKYYLPSMHFIAKLRNFDKASICTFSKCLVIRNEDRFPPVCPGNIKDVLTLFGKLTLTNKKFPIYDTFIAILNTKIAESKRLLNNKCTLKTGKFNDYRNSFGNSATLTEFSASCNRVMSFKDIFHYVFRKYETEPPYINQETRGNFDKSKVKKTEISITISEKCKGEDIMYFNNMLKLLNDFKISQDFYAKYTGANMDLVTRYNLQLDTSQVNKCTKELMARDAESVKKYIVLNAECIQGITDHIQQFNYLSLINQLINTKVPHSRKYNLVDTRNILNLLIDCNKNEAEKNRLNNIIDCIKQKFTVAKIEAYNRIVTTPFNTQPEVKPGEKQMTIPEPVEHLTEIIKMMPMVDKMIDYIISQPIKGDLKIYYDFLISLKSTKIVNALVRYKKTTGPARR